MTASAAMWIRECIHPFCILCRMLLYICIIFAAIYSLSCFPLRIASACLFVCLQFPRRQTLSALCSLTLTRTPSCPLDRNNDEDADNFCAGADDECPKDPAKRVSGPCGCNVKEVHSDGDRIPDCIVRLMLSQLDWRSNNIVSV